MKPHGVVIGLLMGCVCLVIALVPGLFSGLMEGVQNFRDSLTPGVNWRPQHRAGFENRQRPIYLAVLGALLITLSLFEYLSTR